MSYFLLLTALIAYDLMSQPASKSPWLRRARNVAAVFVLVSVLQYWP